MEKEPFDVSVSWRDIGSAVLDLVKSGFEKVTTPYPLASPQDVVERSYQAMQFPQQPELPFEE